MMFWHDIDSNGAVADTGYFGEGQNTNRSTRSIVLRYMLVRYRSARSTVAQRCAPLAVGRE